MNTPIVAKAIEATQIGTSPGWTEDSEQEPVTMALSMSAALPMYAAVSERSTRPVVPS